VTPVQLRILLDILAAEPSRADQDRLMDTLWPSENAEPQDPEGCFRVHLHGLRRVLAGVGARVVSAERMVWVERGA
jgi:DNA-binding winged helix-turn-helix (wHTH) protein